MKIFAKQSLSLGLLVCSFFGGRAFSGESIEYIVKLKPGAAFTQPNNLFRSSRPLETSFGQFQVVKAPANSAAFTAALASDPSIEYMEPNYEYKLVEDEETPAANNAPFVNDPREAEQWALPFINAQAAWKMTKGSSDIIVAVMDSGIYYDHLDLAKNAWVNQAEKDGQPGVDDDNNGYIDDVHGYDFAYGDSDPKDGSGHGSHSAGTIGATQDNNEGIKGLNADVKLMAVQMTYADGGGATLDKILLAIDYAIKMHANIMTNSWAGVDNSQALKDAISAAGAAGIPFVAAAGNNKRNIDSQPIYPASYALDNIIVVGGHDQNGNLSSRSNWGSGTVDIMAPGVDILSTVNKTDWRPVWYRLSSGTSMATPFVAGAIAMLYAKEGKMPFATIRERLIRTSRNAGKFTGKSKGGTLDLANFLSDGHP